MPPTFERAVWTQLAEAQPPHPNFDDRRILFILLQVSRTLALPYDSELARRPQVEDADDAYDQAKLFALQNLQQTADLTLGDFASVVRDAMSAQLKRFPRPAAVERFRADTDIRCAACSGAQPPCSNALTDELILVKNPHCMRAFLDIFDYCAAKVEALYNAFGACPQFASKVRVALGTRSTEHAVLSAKTMFPTGIQGDKFGSRAARIEITFDAHDFNVQTYLSLISLFMHELGVHAFQTMEAVGPRPLFGDESAFSEGLVDQVIHDELISWLASPDALPDELAKISRSLSNATVTNHASRMTLLARGPHDNAFQRKERRLRMHRFRGAEALRSLHALRARHADASHRDPEAIRSWALSVVLHLNMGLERPEDREDFVDALLDAVDGPDATELHSALNIVLKSCEFGPFTEALETGYRARSKGKILPQTQE